MKQAIGFLKSVCIVVLIFGLNIPPVYATCPRTRGPDFPNTVDPNLPLGALVRFAPGHTDALWDRWGDPNAPFVSGNTARSLGRAAIMDIHDGVFYVGSEWPGSSNHTANNMTSGQAMYDYSDVTRPRLMSYFRGVPGSSTIPRGDPLHTVNAHGFMKMGRDIRLGRTYRSGPDGTPIMEGMSRWARPGDPHYLDGYPFPLQAGIGLFPGVGNGSRGGYFAGWLVATDRSANNRPPAFQWPAYTGVVADPMYLYERPRTGADLVEVGRFNQLATSGVEGFPFIFGNFLIIVGGHRADQGLAAYDISDPANPQFLHRINTPQGTGTYWPAVWRDKLFLIDREEAIPANLPPNTPGDHWRDSYSNGGRIHIFDMGSLFDPTPRLRFLQELGVRGNPKYARCKDPEGICATERTIVNMLPLLEGQPAEIILEVDERPGAPDTSEFNMFAGPYMITGGYEATPVNGDGLRTQGVGVWKISNSPDTDGPMIGWQVPRDGEQRYSTRSMLSFNIAGGIETVDLSVGETFIVKPVGGGPNTITTGAMVYNSDGMLSYNPDNDLAEGTTYEIIFTTNSIFDYSCNDIQRTHFGSVIDRNGTTRQIAYRSTFRTAGEGDPPPVLPDAPSNLRFLLIEDPAG